MQSRNQCLQNVELKPEYNTEDDSIVRDLYHPCLQASVRYDRAVGYFRANIYRELGEDLLDFSIAGGRTRIVCSPDIPEPDEEAAREGYTRRGTRPLSEREASVVEVMEAMSRNPDEADCLNMLRLLIENETLELYIATRSGGIYHRKVGTFYDSCDDMVVFSGSGNETPMAVSSIENWGNDEEFDVFRSWGGDFESSKALRKAEYLQGLFEGGTKYTEVRPLNEVEREVLSRFRTHSDFEDCRRGARKRNPAAKEERESGPSITPRFYQSQAIDSWESAGRVGMLSMATATGKTVTALLAISPLLKEGHPVLILVPSKILLSQWHDEIRNFYPDVPVLLAGGGHNWRNNSYKRAFVSGEPGPRIVLATMSTAATDDFLEFFAQAESPVLIADEAHRLGSTRNRRILSSIEFTERIGLSATPERLFDEEGDKALKEAFGSEPVFNLPLGGRVKTTEDSEEVPVLGEYLSRYDYYFETVSLTADEQEQWESITNEIRPLVARHASKAGEMDLRSVEDNRLQTLFIKRARILKRARNKVETACRVIAEKYPSDGKWIVYCEDENQLDRVADAIRSENPHLTVLKYHSKMGGQERDRTLEYFERHPSVIVSIGCLDEGVDIPVVDGAVILASSTNPRQYIQRRGRVLRKSEGKYKAIIIDTVVLPYTTSENEVGLPIVRGELARAWEFANLAENKGVTNDLWAIAQEYGVDLEMDTLVGIEEDEE